MDIVDRLWLISLVFIFNCYFPSKEQNLYIGNAMLSVDEQCALSCQKEGGFRENLFGWFCPLFAPLLLPFELHLCHELTIGAGYHSQSYAKRLSVYIVIHKMHEPNIWILNSGADTKYK